MTTINQKVSHTTAELNAIWNKTEKSNDKTNRQLLGLAPVNCKGEQVTQFTLFYTGKKIRAALDATDSQKWSQKKMDKFDKENGTQHGLILSEITDKTYANTIRSICLHCWDNLTAWEEAIESVTPDYKINSLESFYKAIKEAMKATDEATETTETGDEATETTDEATETFPEPESVEEFGTAIAALYLAGMAKGFNEKEMAQIATDVMKRALTNTKKLAA
jgi:hypothetical protein|tara:strand:+ start:263 stop:925 length:663 start_codon:yes stop_codon:yes gene_type:complete